MLINLAVAIDVNDDGADARIVGLHPTIDRVPAEATARRVNVAGPSSAAVGAPITLTVTADGYLPGPVQVTPRVAPAGKGTFSPATVELRNRSRSATIAFTPTSDGDVSLTVTTDNSRIRGQGRVDVVVSASSTGPILDSISPDTVHAGLTLPPTLTVNGRNLTENCVLVWAVGDVELETVTTFYESGVIHAHLTVPLIAAEGEVEVFIRDTVTLEESDPLTFVLSPYIDTQPNIISLSPDTIDELVGPPLDGFVLTVFGTEFSSACKVLWDGAMKATTFDPDLPDRLTAEIPYTDRVASGLYPIIVVNQATDEQSNLVNFEVTAYVEPEVTRPHLTRIEPTTIQEDTAFTLTCYGENLGGTTQIWLGGNAKTTDTTNAASGSVSCAVLAADVPTGGVELIVQLRNTSTLEFTYAQLPLAVSVAPDTVPRLDSIDPPTKIAGSVTAPFTLTARGANLNDDTVIVWNEGGADPYGFGDDFTDNYTHFPGNAGSIVNTASGAIEVTAGTDPFSNANDTVLWCKNAPPGDDYCFSFVYEWRDGFTETPPGGVFSQFMFSYTGLGTAAVPADPNDWSASVYGGAEPNQDSMFGLNGTGFRVSFNNINSETSGGDKVRVRGYNRSATVVPISPTDQAFVMAVNKAYKVYVRVTGNTCSILARHPDTGVEQIGTWTNSHIGATKGGAFGFRFSSGRKCRVSAMKVDTWPGAAPSGPRLGELDTTFVNGGTVTAQISPDMVSVADVYPVKLRNSATGQESVATLNFLASAQPSTAVNVAGLWFADHNPARPFEASQGTIGARVTGGVEDGITQPSKAGRPNIGVLSYETQSGGPSHINFSANTANTTPTQLALPGGYATMVREQNIGGKAWAYKHSIDRTAYGWQTPVTDSIRCEVAGSGPDRFVAWGTELWHIGAILLPAYWHNYGDDFGWAVHYQLHDGTESTSTGGLTGNPPFALYWKPGNGNAAASRWEVVLRRYKLDFGTTLRPKGGARRLTEADFAAYNPFAKTRAQADVGTWEHIIRTGGAITDGNLEGRKIPRNDWFPGEQWSAEIVGPAAGVWHYFVTNFVLCPGPYRDPGDGYIYHADESNWRTQWNRTKFRLWHAVGNAAPTKILDHTGFHGSPHHPTSTIKTTQTHYWKDGIYTNIPGANGWVAGSNKRECHSLGWREYRAVDIMRANGGRNATAADILRDFRGV